MAYAIHESNINKLEDKLTTIRNRCDKLGCEFYYERVGEEFRDATDSQGRTCKIRFILVEAYGLAIINGWRFVAVLDHTDNGNIIRQYDYNLDVPEKYRNSDLVCEHCNTKRNRKDTYLIYNDNTGEWKQVGKSCLQLFTNGFSADLAAMFMSYFDELEQMNNKLGLWNHTSHRYYPVKDILLYGYECVKHFGYQKADSFYKPTGWRSFAYYELVELGKKFPVEEEQEMRSDIEHHGFNAYSEENIDQVDKMIEWISSADNENNTYLHNLKTLISSKYTNVRYVPLVVSLIASYTRHIKDEEAKAQKEQALSDQADNSQHVGSIKERLTVKVKSSELVASWDSKFGWQGIYKFIDMDGNVFIWVTSAYVEPGKEVDTIVGTVKEHGEYNGVKQTVLTRCKIEYKEEV